MIPDNKTRSRLTFFKASANAFTGHEYPLNLDKSQGFQFENLKLLALNQ